MQHPKTRKLALAAMFAALTAVFSQIIVPLPFTPVMFSASLVAVFLTGAILDKKTALLSQFAYVLLGTVGVPVFSELSGGLHKIAGPTGGYLIAYPLMAVVISYAAEKWGRSWRKLSFAMLFSLLICYTVGTVQLMLVTGAPLLDALTMGVFPFVLFDIGKCLLSAWFGVLLDRALTKSHLYAR